jgi:DNA-binding NarL/FixJ family response regulator
MSAKAALRVLIVDDHPVVRDGLAAVIGSQPDMTVAAQVGDGAEAVRLFDEHRPDVTLMDLRLPTLSGWEAMEAIRRQHERARFVVLTTFEGDEDVYRACKAGAQGYLLKGAPSATILDVIRAVHAGETRIPSELRSRVSERPPHSELSTRERDVMVLLAEGASTEEIAERLGVSTHTVRSHVRVILGKLDARDRAQAISEAIRRGIVHLR